MTPRSVGAILLAATIVASVAVAGIGPASQSVAAQQGAFVVEQGDRCEAITPLSGAASAAEFYDYRHHGTHEEDYAYSSHGTTGLQENDVSSVFLYEGPEGLSLVTVHDRLDGGTGGGAAEFRMTGLPAGGAWTVQDDDYSENADDVWRHGDVWSDVAWLWGANRTDGGVYTGLGNDFEVTIDPALNDGQSTFEPAAIDGTVREIHVLSGDAEAPDRTPMASTEEPFVIRTGDCDDPSVRYERTGQGVQTPVIDETGEPVERVQQGVLASVEDTAGEPVALRPPAAGGNGIEYDRLSVVASGPETPTGAATGTAEIEMGIEETPEIPESDGVILSVLSTEATEGSVDDATLTFGVERATLEEHDAAVDDVTVYEGGDGWQRIATDPVEGSADDTRFRAEADGDGPLAVVLEEPPIRATELALGEERIEAGESVEISATVENVGDAPETGSVSLIVFGEVVDSREVTLEPGQTERLTFEQRVDSPGSHTIEVAGESEQVEVEGGEDEGSAPDGGDGGSGDSLAVGIGVSVLVALALWWRRSPE